MKKIMKNRKKSVFPKFIKILMAGLMVFGVMQIPGQSINADNVVHAMDAEAKASFDGVTVKDGAKISLGGQFATYVGNETLLSDKTSARVAGDTAAIETGSNAVWNSYYSKDRANAMGVLRQNGLPSIAEINLWKNNIPSVGAGYWLNDAKNISVDDGSGLTTSTGKKYSFETRAVASGDNKMADARRAISLSGKYLNEVDTNNHGAKFDGRSIEVGEYINISDINLSEYNVKKGYYKDLFAKQNSEIKNDFFMAWTGFNPNSTDSYVRMPQIYLNYNQDYDTLSDSRKSMTLDFYKKVELDANNKPVLNKEDRVTIQKTITYGDRVTRPMGLGSLTVIAGLLYDPIEETLMIPEVGKIYPKGTLLVYLQYDSNLTQHNGTPDKMIINDKIFLLDEDENTTESISGKQDVIVSEEDYYGKKRMLSPAYDSYPFEIPNGVKILYAQAPIDFKILYSDNVDAVSKLTRTTVTEGLRYYETDKTIQGTTLPGTTNIVRPKMTLDTSKIKFARENTSSIINKTPTLGAMPDTVLNTGSNYKLVLNNDDLGVNTIVKGTTEGVSAKNNTVAADKDTSNATISEDNVISVTPGTTEITIPVSTLSGNKVSAVSTKKDDKTATYGVVGNVTSNKGSITINIADLMDTNKVTSATTSGGKTITLFNEQLNAAGYSDEISKEGLELTIKVENSQEIDFTTDTKENLLNQTYAYGDTFTVEAEVTKKGNGDVADTVTPITFTTSIEHLEMQGIANWDKTTLKGAATFKVVKPYTGSEELKIAINRAVSNTHDPAPEVKSTNIKTEKRKIDLIIDPTLLVAEKGKDRLSLKGGDTMPDITERYITYKPGTTTEDAVAKADKEHIGDSKIPYTLETTHWLGGYTGGTDGNDDVLVNDGKVSQKVAGNIWKLNIIQGTDANENAWFNERYEVVSKSPTNAIVDVYDKTGNESTSTNEILYANHMSMSLDNYKSKFAVGSLEDKKRAIIKESSFKVTNNASPYREINGKTEDIVKVLNAESHAGEYEVQYSLDSGSALRTSLVVADVLTRNETTNEELRANTYIHQKGKQWDPDIGGGYYGKQMKIELVDLKTGEKKKVSGIGTGTNMLPGRYGDITAWKELGETTFKITTKAGTEVTTKIIIRDHVVVTGNIRTSANNLMLSVNEATQLVNQLKDKDVDEQVEILTPADGTTSNFGMYPYATNVVKGNKSAITSITGLPEIPSGKTAVADGVYNVVFETADGATVSAKISVYVDDPTAYVLIPEKIELKEDSSKEFIASKSAQVRLEPGKDTVLEDLNNKIVIKTAPTLEIKGTTEGNTGTRITVSIYDSSGAALTAVDNAKVILAELDKTLASKDFTLKIKNDPAFHKNSSDLYTGKMEYGISFEKPLAGSTK